MGTAPAFASVGEALDMVRAGLGYLAAADATRLAAATQAECLRELEQAGAVATAARAAVLAAFTAGQGYAGDAEYSAVSWLIHRTGITRGAAVGHAAWARPDPHPPQGGRGAGRRAGLRVGGAADLPVDRASCRRSSGTSPRSCCSPPRPRGWGWRSWRRWSRRCTSGPGPSCRTRTRSRDFADRGAEAGGHVRRRRGHPRGSHPGVRGGGRAGAGRAGRPGRERRRPDEGPAVPRRAGRGDAAAGGQRAAAGAGRAAGQGLGAYLAGRPAAARRRLRAAGAVDRPGPGPVGGAAGVRVRDRQRGRGLAGRARTPRRSRATRRWPRW